MGVRKGHTGDILAFVDATVNRSECATGNDGLDDELGGIDLPLMPLLLHGPGGGPDVNMNTIASSTVKRVILLLLVLLHDPSPVEVLVQALQINLIGPHKPIAALLHLFAFSESGQLKDQREQ